MPQSVHLNMQRENKIERIMYYAFDNCIRPNFGFKKKVLKI